MEFFCEMVGLNQVAKEDFKRVFTDVVSREHVTLLKKAYELCQILVYRMVILLEKW